MVLGLGFGFGFGFGFGLGLGLGVLVRAGSSGGSAHPTVSSSSELVAPKMAS